MRTSVKPLEVKRDPSRSGERHEAGRDLDTLIAAFDPSARRSVRRLVCSSSRVADLAAVFPGAVYAMATRRASQTRRRKALELIERGALLREVARTLELPMWLRRLPASAFAGPLAETPQSDLFSRRIVNHLPRKHDDAAFWFQSVQFAAKAADDYFALWLAEQPLFHDKGTPQRLFAVLAAYAWHSTAEPSGMRAMIVVPWRPEMAFDTAVCAAKSWLNRIRLVLQLRPGAITDTWLTPGEAMGFTFLPLIEHTDILAEANAMQNCADQYADRIARDRCRLFSIRRQDARVATLEIAPHPREAGVLTISQLKSRHNMPAANEIWQAAHAWMATQKALHKIPTLAIPERTLDAATWESLMSAYRKSRRGAPWIPDKPALAAFSELETDLGELARRGGVSSWLFT